MFVWFYFTVSVYLTLVRCVDESLSFNDPLYTRQWHLQTNEWGLQVSQTLHVFEFLISLFMKAVWQSGIRGKGIVIGFAVELVDEQNPGDGSGKMDCGFK
jgi:hypothetical protein